MALAQGLFPRTDVMIGNMTLPNNVFLAPMSGVSDAPFRRLVARLGAGLVISEMTASQDLVEADPHAIRRAEGGGIACHVVQLAGCEARWMAEGAKVRRSSWRRCRGHQHGLPRAACHWRRNPGPP